MNTTARGGRDWCLYPPALSDDKVFIDTVSRLHSDLFDRYFANEMTVNARLGIQLRAFRRIEEWRVLLLLTPWMLSRLLAPDAVPPIAVPADWSADACANRPYEVLGPRVELSLLGQPQQAHLNYHRTLGHYLLQPIALNMEPYDSPEAVFAAWNHVIQVRDENMEKHRKDCPWQKEVSRRELLSRLRPKS